MTLERGRCLRQKSGEGLGRATRHNGPCRFIEERVCEGSCGSSSGRTAHLEGREQRGIPNQRGRRRRSVSARMGARAFLGCGVNCGGSVGGCGDALAKGCLACGHLRRSLDRRQPKEAASNVRTHKIRMVYRWIHTHSIWVTRPTVKALRCRSETKIFGSSSLRSATTGDYCKSNSSH